jgi:allantoin racemase
MRILVINPNASRAMSAVIQAQLEALAGPDVQVEVVNPDGAPPAIESALDEARAIPPMLDVVAAAARRGADAVVIACFSDPGLDAAREATPLPVVGIQEASLYLAAQLGRRFSILTTLAHRVPARHRAARLASLEERLASCPVLDLPVLDTVRDRERVLTLLLDRGRRAIAQDGAEVLILGCAGLGDLAPRVQQALGVPVVDPNAAGLKLAETLVSLGLVPGQAARPAGQAPVAALLS